MKDTEVKENTLQDQSTLKSKIRKVLDFSNQKTKLILGLVPVFILTVAIIVSSANIQRPFWIKPVAAPTDASTRCTMDIEVIAADTPIPTIPVTLTPASTLTPTSTPVPVAPVTVPPNLFPTLTPTPTASFVIPTRTPTLFIEAPTTVPTTIPTKTPTPTAAFTIPTRTPTLFIAP